MDGAIMCGCTNCGVAHKTLPIGATAEPKQVGSLAYITREGHSDMW